MGKFPSSIIKLITISSFLSFILSQVYEQATYVSYNSASKFHNIELIWGTSKADPKTDANSYKVSVDKVDSNTITTTTYKNENSLNTRYIPYLPDFDGKNSKIYVAYDVTAVCDNTSKVRTANFKIKFFNCLADATTFYNSATGHKLLNDNVNTPTTTGEPLNGEGVNTLLGFATTNIGSTCPA